MKKSFNLGVCKAFASIACAAFIFAGMNGVNSISAKAADVPYSVDLSNGNSVKINDGELSGVTKSQNYPKNYKDFTMLESAIKIYGPEIDSTTTTFVLSEKPYQAIAASATDYCVILSAAKNSVGSGKYIISKDTYIASRLKANNMPESMGSIFSKSAKEFIQNCERVVNGKEGTGDSVFVVTIKYSSLPVLITNKVNGDATVSYMTGYEFEADGIKYRVSNTKGNLTALYLTKGVKTVNVPDSVVYSGYTMNVTDIAPFFIRGNKKVKNVTVGKNVTTIGKQAFWNCKKLKKVKIKSTKVTSFGRKAFGKDAKDFYVKTPKSSKKNYEKLFTKSSIKGIKVK
ncbi:leucine-rich repeat protein [Butyrivibrio sp. XPD2002]|uniref:leucine-rich repeat protein n=1 Tax=Butyrivibrio sp. XPD2002 TaxID=1280665 RepID=UPI0004245BD9|nr:leucine-rich repeat protein [Butyrivibrio sp. XPD2002]